MRNIFKISGLVLIIFLTYSCKKANNDKANASDIKDGNGNVYTSIIVGTQTWLEKDLKATKFNDGSDIQLVTDGEAWASLSTPGYCWYNNDVDTYKDIYGVIYNGYSVNPAINGGKNVCPTGWHVPKDTEWTTLAAYLGGESVAGGKLKETGTIHWLSPNTGATNEIGFTALPGGFRHSDGTFKNIRNNSYLWSTTECAINNAWFKYMTYNSSSVSGYCDGYVRHGFYVRCLKN
jgi:uncharacterized protein (TIGR02145 family)